MKPDTSDTNYIYAEGKDALAVLGEDDGRVEIWLTPKFHGGDGWSARFNTYAKTSYCTKSTYRKPKHLVKPSFSIYEAPIRGSVNEIEHQKAIMHAWVDGATVEWVHCGDRNKEWRSVINPNWNWKLFEYRINSPAPKEKVLKPWNFETAPKGCVLLRDKATFDVFGTALSWYVLHGQFMVEAFFTGNCVKVNSHDLLDEYKHSLDGGATWNPCGTYE